MPALPHLTRRDGVFYWRRKVRPLSTTICDLRVSLRTTDRARATILSRVLSAESEPIMAALEQDRITLEEARRYLQHVVKSHVTAEHDLRQDLRFRYGKPPCEIERQIVRGINEAWDILADQGIGASISDRVEQEMIAAGRTRAEVAMLRLILDSNFGPLLRSHVGAYRRAAVFEEVNGRRINGPREEAQLLELHIEGMRAASAVAATPPTRALASEVLRQFEPARGVFSSEGLPADAPRPDVADAASGMTAHQPVDIPPPPVQDSLPEPLSLQLDPSIDAVIARMLEFKRNAEEGLEDKTARQYTAFGTLLQRVTGKSDVRSLMQPDLVNFRSVLFKIPKSFGKSPSDHTLPIETILAKAAMLPKGKVGLSVGTVNRYVDHASALVAAAKSEGFELHPRLDPSSLRRKEKVRQRDKKRTFTLNELKTLFAHQYWTDPGSGRGLPPLDVRRTSGLYWVPLIAAYTAMRREEIAGIGVDYIRDEDGIVFFDVIDTDDRRLKTAASRRRIPVHNDLMDLGLLEVVRAAKRGASGLLFPDLREPASKIMGRKVGRHMEKIVWEIWEEAGDGLSVQSIRHYVQHLLDLDKNVPEKVVRDLMGHEGTDVHSSVYGDQSPLVALKAAVDRLPSLVRTQALPR
jgi:integrase